MTLYMKEATSKAHGVTINTKTFLYKYNPPSRPLHPEAQSQEMPRVRFATAWPDSILVNQVGCRCLPVSKTPLPSLPAFDPELLRSDQDWLQCRGALPMDE